MGKQEDEVNFQAEIYRMAVQKLATDAQRLEEIINSLPEGVDLPQGISLDGNDGFSFTSDVEPIALERPVEVSFHSSSSVQAFAAEFGLSTRLRLDVGLHTDADDEGTFRRLRERIDAGEDMGDTTYLFDSQGRSMKLAFLPSEEVRQRDIIVDFEDGGYVPSTMNPGDVELAGSIMNALTTRTLSLSNGSTQESTTV